MNRIKELFERERDGLLSVYFTAGFPRRDSTMEILEALSEGGADLVEIGIPYSDPVADGRVIQESNKKALGNGMSMKLLFEQIRDLRKRVGIPVILMGYFNPVLQFGLERFCSECSKLGIDGVIIPDMPPEVYLKQYKQLFDSNGLLNIFLITPQSREQRIRMIDGISDGFIYMVSSDSITGSKKDISTCQMEYFNRISGMKLQHPTLIGFGVSKPEHYRIACTHSRGAIVGSAFIRMLDKAGPDLRAEIRSFIRNLKEN